MSQKLVCIDSQIFIWGIKKWSIPSQKNKVDLAVYLLDKLTEDKYRIILPVPMLSEILSPVPIEKQSEVMRLIDRRFLIAPFDSMAAIKCAELIHLNLTTDELKAYRKTQLISKSKMKYDCMIASIAIVRRAECIYSEDKEMGKFSCGQIKVLPLPPILK